MTNGFSIDGMEDLFREDILRFLRALERRLARLQAHPADRAASDEVRAIGHSLRGTTALVGLSHLSRCGAVIERMTESAVEEASSHPDEAREICSLLHGSLGLIERILEVCLVHGDEAELDILYRQVRDGFPDRFQHYFVDETAPSSARERGEPADEADGADDDEAFAAELAEVFSGELKENLDNIPSELALLPSENTRVVANHKLNRIFHTIKGSAAMVGLQDLSDAARRLELSFEGDGIFAGDALASVQEDLNRVYAAGGIEAPDLAAVMSAPAVAEEEIELERELLAAFRIDAKDALQRCEDLLLELEKEGGAPELLQALFRQFHTLKGAAGAVGLGAISTQVHEGESLLESIIEGETAIDGGVLVDFLFRFTDSVNGLVDQALGRAGPPRRIMKDVQAEIAALRFGEVRAPVAAPVPVPEPGVTIEAPVAAEARVAIAPEAEPGIVRVQANRLDSLMNQVGQLVFTRARMDQKVLGFSDFQEKLYGARARLADTIEGFQRRFEFTIGGSPIVPRSAVSAREATQKVPDAGQQMLNLQYGSGVDDFFTDLEFDKYDDFNILARSVIELATDMGEIADQLGQYIDGLEEETRQFSKITSGLQRQITTLRLVPLETVFRRLVRPVRDAARQEMKLVDLQMTGGEVQVDRAVAESLYAPLLHLVRNAVTHGIELPGVREVAGKARVGTIRITAAALYNSVVLSVEDDGAGINFNAIAAKARALKLFDADVHPGREDLLSLIFRPGFSTGESVTDLAGRGVGMDVVARQVAALNGSVLVDSKERQGTSFRLSLPITTSIEEVLLLDVEGQLYALPISFVERSVMIEAEEIAAAVAEGAIVVGEENLPVLLLGPLAGKALPSETAVGVVLRAGDRAMLLVVDRVLAQQEVVIRPLNRVLSGHPFLSGGTISGTGDVVFILQVGRLFEILSRASEQVSEAVEAIEAPALEEAPHGILMVDDSISVRKLAARFLESSGLEVVTAVDGVDALERMTQQRFQVIVTDLEMPRMHGYDLIAAIRSNPRWANVPIIVCTSRASEKHRHRAEEAGADGYLTKPFSKDELIDEIHRVTGETDEDEIAPTLGDGVVDA